MRKVVDLLTASEQKINLNKFPANFLMTSFDEMTPREIAYAAHVAGRMEIVNQNFWFRLSSAAVDAATKSPPKYLAPILFSLASRSTEDVMSRLLSEISSKTSQARGCDIALTLKAVAKSPFQLSHIVEGILDLENVKSMSSREKLLSAISMSKMKMHACKSILPSIAVEVSNELIDFSPEELSGLLRAFASAGVEIPLDVRVKYISHISACTLKATPDTLPLLLTHLKTLELWSDEIADRGLDNFLENCSSHSPQSTAQVLHALASRGKFSEKI